MLLFFSWCMDTFILYLCTINMFFNYLRRVSNINRYGYLQPCWLVSWWNILCWLIIGVGIVGFWFVLLTFFCFAHCCNCEFLRWAYTISYRDPPWRTLPYGARGYLIFGGVRADDRNKPYAQRWEAPPEVSGLRHLGCRSLYLTGVDGLDTWRIQRMDSGNSFQTFPGKRMWFAVGWRLDRRVTSGNCNED